MTFSPQRLKSTFAKILLMSRRTNRMSAELAAFAQQYKRKAQRGAEPNDRGYSREVEALMKRLPAAELSAALNSDGDERLPSPKPKKQPPDDGLPMKTGRRP
ncbi:hypothetical protein [Variovorax paradoxus]|uniref:hypothetical protein n=1 Tax=Variovorax paradoxus TaxID=34073 RepID=UPI0029C695A7|nr:hypothetical protein RZE77_31660 [Variovorax paradoxus]